MRTSLIRAKLEEMKESVQIIEDNLPSTLEEFQSLGLVKDGIYKRVEYALENVFAICSIINSDLNLGIPSNEVGVLENLEKNHIFIPELLEKLKSMKGFRNILVHRYGNLNDQMAFRNLQIHLKDFSIFKEEVESLL
ncbi:MAG: hypothetical protein BME94_00325 [Methanobacteriales archaeon Met13]